jgi:hypothetical protein
MSAFTSDGKAHSPIDIAPVTTAQPITNDRNLVFDIPTSRQLANIMRCPGIRYHTIRKFARGASQLDTRVRVDQ